MVSPISADCRMAIVHTYLTEGTGVLWTRRIIVALLSIQDQWVVWPDHDRRLEIKTRVGRASAFPQCIGFIDGSHLPLDIKPVYEGNADFFNRKGRYSLNCLFVCDDEHRINYMCLGWGGSAHDSRVFRNTPVSLGGSTLLSYQCTDLRLPTSVLAEARH